MTSTIRAALLLFALLPTPAVANPPPLSLASGDIRFNLPHGFQAVPDIHARFPGLGAIPGVRHVWVSGPLEHPHAVVALASTPNPPRGRDALEDYLARTARAIHTVEPETALVEKRLLQNPTAGLLTLHRNSQSLEAELALEPGSNLEQTNLIVPLGERLNTFLLFTPRPDRALRDALLNTLHPSIQTDEVPATPEKPGVGMGLWLVVIAAALGIILFLRLTGRARRRAERSASESPRPQGLQSYLDRLEEDPQRTTPRAAWEDDPDDLS